MLYLYKIFCWWERKLSRDFLNLELKEISHYRKCKYTHLFLLTFRFWRDSDCDCLIFDKWLVRYNLAWTIYMARLVMTFIKYISQRIYRHRLNWITGSIETVKMKDLFLLHDRKTQSEKMTIWNWYKRRANLQNWETKRFRTANQRRKTNKGN